MSITRRNVYRIYLLMFIAALLPLLYAGLKKTQSIQVITIILRWRGKKHFIFFLILLTFWLLSTAFFSMVGITLKILTKGEATGHPEVVNILSVPKMFGICVYGK